MHNKQQKVQLLFSFIHVEAKEAAAYKEIAFLCTLLTSHKPKEAKLFYVLFSTKLKLLWCTWLAVFWMWKIYLHLYFWGIKYVYIWNKARYYLVASILISFEYKKKCFWTHKLNKKSLFSSKICKNKETTKFVSYSLN